MLRVTFTAAAALPEPPEGTRKHRLRDHLRIVSVNSPAALDAAGVLRTPVFLSDVDLAVLSRALEEAPTAAAARPLNFVIGTTGDSGRLVARLQRPAPVQRQRRIEAKAALVIVARPRNVAAKPATPKVALQRQDALPRGKAATLAPQLQPPAVGVPVTMWGGMHAAASGALPVGSPVGSQADFGATSWGVPVPDATPGVPSHKQQHKPQLSCHAEAHAADVLAVVSSAPSQLRTPGGTLAAATMRSVACNAATSSLAPKWWRKAFCKVQNLLA